MFSSFRLWKKPNNNIKNLSTNIPDNSCMYCSYIYWRHLSSLKVMETHSSNCRNTIGYRWKLTKRIWYHFCAISKNTEWNATNSENDDHIRASYYGNVIICNAKDNSRIGNNSPPF